MTSRLADRRLFIADLVQRMADMESRRSHLDPLLYRVLARRLHQAADGLPEPALAGNFGPFNPQVDELLEDRHFDAHGQLRGTRATRCRVQARRLLTRLGVRPTAHDSPVDPGC